MSEFRDFVTFGGLLSTPVAVVTGALWVRTGDPGCARLCYLGTCGALSSGSALLYLWRADRAFERWRAEGGRRPRGWW
jgi:hypothetical protein